MSVFGYVNENDDSLKGKKGGFKFGLNTGFITKLEHNGNAGKDNSAGDAVDIEFTSNGASHKARFYDVTRVYKDNEQIEANHPDYTSIYHAEINQVLAVITHAIKATGVTEEQLKQALATPPSGFADWAKIVCGVVSSDFATRPVDAFFEYQWTIKGDNDKTFLQLPKNMKGGRFLCPAMVSVGKWTEVKDADGLHYVDEAQNKHQFTRTSNYMESNKAIQQFDNAEEAPSAINSVATDKASW